METAAPNWRERRRGSSRALDRPPQPRPAKEDRKQPCTRFRLTLPETQKGTNTFQQNERDLSGPDKASSRIVGFAEKTIASRPVRIRKNGVQANDSAREPEWSRAAF
jgi:hypothetical protein